MRSSAVLSDCGLYRYCLIRQWADGPTCGFIMLNPSTADATLDDPTIRRCIGFAKREGCGGLLVANLFAFRATDPRKMADADDPIGPHADEHLRRIADTVDGPLIAAWGAHWMAGERAEQVKSTFGNRLMCLGVTKDGHPRHPLYVKADAPLFPLVAGKRQ